MYLTVIVLVSSWIRRGIGPAWWRKLHVLAVPAFSLTMVHGIAAGSDSMSPWMWLMYSSTGLIVVAMLLVRGLSTRAGAKTRVKVTRPEGRTALAAGPRPS
jgi:DMSO/TMAO reductase YedYZ heme-binding membrane subunit